MYIKEFPFNNYKYLKISGIVRGRIQGRLHQYFLFFYVFKIDFMFMLQNAEQPDNYMKSIAVIFLLIFTELQFYDKNCNDVKRRKKQDIESTILMLQIKFHHYRFSFSSLIFLYQYTDINFFIYLNFVQKIESSARLSSENIADMY